VTRALGTAGPTRSRRRGGGRRCHRRPPRHGCGRRRGDALPQPRDNARFVLGSGGQRREEPGPGPRRRREATTASLLPPRGRRTEPSWRSQTRTASVSAHMRLGRVGGPGSSERVFGRRHELGRVIV
jgi:hypothetical protein